MLVIGITGQFASGKSTVAKILSRRLKAEIIDADKIGHTVLLDKKVKGQLNGYFGAVDRKVLAARAFASAENHKALCRITHPLLVRKIKDRLEAIKAKNSDSIVIIDAAVLIEMGLLKYVDKLIVVKAGIKRQLGRAKQIWHMSPLQVRQRIKLQISNSRLLGIADFVIDNNGDLKQTTDQVIKILEALWQTKN